MLRHYRRSVAPWWWPIARKEAVWTVKVGPGPHSAHKSIPLAILVRDVLRYAKTMREARRIIAAGHIRVDGVPRKDYKFPVGLMDVIEISATGEYYRMLPHPSRHLWPLEISESEASIKPLRVEGKTMVKGGNVQLHFHDGKNMLVPVEEARKYSTLDVVLYSLGERDVILHVPMQLGVYALIVDGHNVGRHGKIADIVRTIRRRQSIAVLSTDGQQTRTVMDYVFPIGKESPAIKIFQ